MTRRAFALVTIVTLVFAVSGQHRFAVSPIDTGTGPSPRADHLAVVLQSRSGFLLIIHGGRDGVGAKSDTWTYFVSQNRWRLLAPSALAENSPPPPMWGAVGGYRFVDGLDFPFLYVTLGRLDSGALTNNMWVMEFKSFTWRKVELDGDLPAPRYGAAGSLERFVKPDGTVQPALIVSHGHGENGPLSDTYKCSFNESDPYRATWRRLHEPVGQYNSRSPHPVSLQTSTFTAARDLVMFGGCYASHWHGGVCPSRLSWLLKYEPETAVTNATEESNIFDGISFAAETDSVSWDSLPSDPAPRIGGAMAQGLNSFADAYKNREGIAVLYSGSLRTEDLPTTHIQSAPHFDGGEVDLLSTTTGAWLKERVHYRGPQDMQDEVLARRMSATLSIVRNSSTGKEEPGRPDEFFLFFGGQHENGSFTNALLKLSFDPFVESEVLQKSGRYVSRPFVHGLLMFISWGLLMVIGAFSSRYMKLTNGRSRYFLFHVFIQTIALVLSWAGAAVMIYGRRGTVANFAHAKIGIVLISLVSLQPIAAVIGILLQLQSSPIQARTTGQRAKARKILIPRLCRFYHRFMGLIIMVLGATNITLGLFLITAPSILWIHWIVYSCLSVIIMILLEVIGGRKPGEMVQTRASSMHRGQSMSQISRGNSYMSRVMHSFRGDSTATALHLERERSYLQHAGVPADDVIPAEDEVLATKSVHELEIQPESIARIESSQEVPVRRSSAVVPLYSTDVMSFEEPLADPPNSTAVVYRERLESGVSSVFTYRDPDAY